MAAAGPDQVRTLAQLARLSLRGDEVERFGQQLAQILAYLEQLQAVDVEGVPEYLAGDQPTSRLRLDEAAEPLSREAALGSAPACRGDMILVPKFKDD